MYLGYRWTKIPSICVLVLILIGIVSHAPSARGQAIQSDDFYSTSLDPRWTFVDSVGDASLVLSGTNALIRVPGGMSHTLWTTCTCAPRLLQSAPNADFEIEVKFDSAPSARYQMQGVVVHEDEDTYLRFDVHHDGTTPKIYAAYLNGVNPPSTVVNATLPAVPPYLRVNRTGSTWQFSYSPDGVAWTTAVTFTRALVVSQVGPFAGNSSDLGYNTPAFVTNIDYFFNTTSPIVPEDGGSPTAQTPPVVDVWYGDSQSVGALGVPQQWVNIVGTVWDTDPVDSLYFSLNGGPGMPLSIGPDGLRLDAEGDFNIEIDYAELSSGPNSVVITALDTLGEQTDHVMNVDYTEGVTAALPYTASFSTAGAVSDAAQIVDGRWFLTAGGVRVDSSATGYDRCITLGDRAWSPNYEVTVPITIHKGNLGGVFSMGVAIGWQGHTGAGQPRLTKPYQALARIDDFPTSPKLVLRDDTQVRGQKDITFDANTPYILKMRSQTFAIGAARVDVKIWAQGAPEPAEWDLGCDLAARFGSIALFAGFAEATFGDVSAAPLNPLGVRSDDFSSTELDTSVWHFVDPQGDATLMLTGTNAIVYIPGGTRHTFSSTGNFAPRLMQAAPDTNFEVEVGFASSGSYYYQGQGILVEEDDDTYLRFELVYGTGNPSVYAGFFDAGVLTSIVYTPVAPTPVYLRVKRSGIAWTFDYSYDAVNWTRAAFFYQPIDAKKVGVSFNNTDGGDAYNMTPAFVGNVDYFFNTSVPITPEDGGAPPAVTLPTVDVWYGDEQEFGHLGVPQRWVNILGTTWDTDDVVSLSYSLNGGPGNPLSVGPDGHRLVGIGDFNIEIDYSDLTPGPNEVVITAVDSIGEQTDRVVTVNYTDGVTWEMMYIADWSAAEKVSDAAYVADGRWMLTDDGVRTAPNSVGYDRLLLMGDRSWPTDYEVAVPLTIHEGSGWSGVGVVIGWTGHLDGTVSVAEPSQPRQDIRYQALAWVRSLPFPSNPVLTLEDDAVVRGQTGVPMDLDVKYVLRVRSETTSPGVSQVSVKYWEDGTPEPPGWMLTGSFATHKGSILLVAHNADVTFGNAAVWPLPSFPLHVLTTTAPTGGSIARFPDYAAYSDSSKVKLTAVPDPGWTFQQWSGGLSGSANPVTMTMVRDTTVSAIFKQGEFSVKMMIAGSGSVVIDPDKTKYLAGDTIVLTATPEPGHYFHGWYGDYVGGDNPDTLIVTKNMMITALFFSEITGIDTPPVIETLTVLQNSPNPFSRETYLHIGLPKATDVKIDVYDVAGRRVFSTQIPDANAGWNRFLFSADGTAGRPLPSGVYFYRVTTREAAVTNRMVVIR